LTEYLVEFTEPPLLDIPINTNTIPEDASGPRAVVFSVQREKIRAQQDQFESDLKLLQQTNSSPSATTDATPKPKIRSKFQNVFNGTAASLTNAEKAALEKKSYIKAIHPNLRVYATLMDSVPLIGANQVWRLDENLNTCQNSTPDHYRVFVTSQTFNGNLGGLAGADAKCMQAARDAHLSGTWKAYLGDSSIRPKDRLVPSYGKYLRMDGTVIANNDSDLTDGSILRPISLNEFGQDVNWQYPGTAGVWIGNLLNPTEHSGNDNYTCKDWTYATNTQGIQAYYGSLTATDQNWELWDPSICASPHHLYCIG